MKSGEIGTLAPIGQGVGALPDHVHAGITKEDADELFALYEMQSRSFQRRSKGMEALVDDLAERLVRHCEQAVRRLQRLPLPQPLPPAEDRRRPDRPQGSYL